jgi:hypothetical protein
MKETIKYIGLSSDKVFLLSGAEYEAKKLIGRLKILFRKV